MTQGNIIKNVYKTLVTAFFCLSINSCGSGGEATEPQVNEPPVVEAPVVEPEVVDISDGFNNIALQSIIENVQPMTGIVFWDNHQVWASANVNAMSDAISLEYSYISVNEIVTGEGVYDWSYLETKLDAIAARNHQAVFRFYYTFPGRNTTVPDYIKERADYNETQGLSEGENTYFPDWTNSELQRFTKEFHSKLAEMYDHDNRLAFIQVGFGLWGEYHIYDGPFLLSETFPSQAYQTEFLEHLSATYTNLPWSISIDASNEEYSPVSSNSALGETKIGLFDDSFMHEQHSGYNAQAWRTLNYDERYKESPMGGEFSYVESSDQVTALTPNTGSYGTSYEEFAQEYRITYMIGNDTYTRGRANEQPISRIKEASMYSGYSFSINEFATNATQAEVIVENTGIAPLYYDAYITVNGVRSTESLKGLLPNTPQKFIVESGGELPELTIESDDILPTQKIEFTADL